MPEAPRTRHHPTMRNDYHLTPLGEAYVQVYRLERHIIDLDPEARKAAIERVEDALENLRRLP